MTKINLWLDDCRSPPDDWTWAKTVEEAKTHLAAGTVDQCSLDHDLGFTDKTGATGYDLVKWMIETGNWPTFQPRVHSQNPVGALWMKEDICRFFPG